MKRQAMMMVFVLAMACLSMAFGQDAAPPEAQSEQPASAWLREGKDADPLHGGSADQFVLVGKYVTPPAQADRQAPSITVTCSGGRLRSITLDVGASVVTVSEHTPAAYLFGVDVSVDDYGKVLMERRKIVTPYLWGRRKILITHLDDTEFDAPTADGHGVNLGSHGAEAGFLDLIYGHVLAHKEGKGDPVHQWIYGVMEANAREIEMQFDMPVDQSEVLAACTTVDKGGHRR